MSSYSLYLALHLNELRSRASIRKKSDATVIEDQNHDVVGTAKKAEIATENLAEMSRVKRIATFDMASLLRDQGPSIILNPIHLR